jgi:hypothetical protein
MLADVCLQLSLCSSLLNEERYYIIPTHAISC